MSENYSFRSSMNGFNRNDVIEYIDSLMAEKKSVSDRLAELEAEISELRSENETLRSVISDIPEATDDDKCSECDIAKKYEARLGAAMLDAKRFSEILVKEANDKSAAVFSEAFDVASKTAADARGITQNIADISKQFSASFRALIDNMSELTKSMEAFQGEIKNSGVAFSYQTDFSDMESVDDSSTLSTFGVSTKSSRAKNAPSVNFDDADDFDIRVDVNV